MFATVSRTYISCFQARYSSGIWLHEKAALFRYCNAANTIIQNFISRQSLLEASRRYTNNVTE